ncbi:MAG: hypothetical protein FJ272_12045, partial [Planctomycetes bacterium]|nr:hypothetical protein [Planctomycetota bacterium]
MRYVRPLCVLTLVSLASCFSAFAQDTDSDGLPDALEARLGTNPAVAEKLDAVWEKPAAPEEQKPGFFEKPGFSAGRDLRKILLANVAGNRYLWALEFAGDFEFKNTNLLMYVDADNNPKRGQKDKALLGTDFVLWLSDGGRGCHGYSLTGEGASAAPTRFGWLGKRVFFCTDMPLAQQDGKSVCRIFAKVESLEPRAEVSSTGWVAVLGQGESARAKPPIGLTPSAAGKDSDGDGIPDSIEELLGTNGNFAEPLELVHDDKLLADGDKAVNKANYSAERDISKFYFGNVAEDRYLWCIEFGGDYPRANSNFILYLDADNDEKTGRKAGAPGTDYMLGLSEGGAGGTAFAPNGDTVPLPSHRAAIVGKRLYLCADLPLRQEDGQSVWRASLLSETRQPAAYVDSTAWFTVRGQGVSTRPKAVGLDGHTRSVNMLMTRGLDLFRKIKADPANVVVKIGDCDLDGFGYDTWTEYKAPSAVRNTPGGRIGLSAPKTGRYHFGFLLYDERGTERIEVRHNDKPLGIAVADEDDRRTKLFFTEKPVAFQAGDRLELRTSMSPGAWRIEDLLFL